MKSTTTISACAGRPYGHVPGHGYYDAEIEARPCGRRWIATLTITWGSAQGYDEEHGRLEYSATGEDAADAISDVAREALGEHTDEGNDDIRGYIQTARSRALREACELCEEAS